MTALRSPAQPPPNQPTGACLARLWLGLSQLCMTLVLMALAFTMSKDSAEVAVISARGRSSDVRVFPGARQRPTFPRPPGATDAAVATPSVAERIEAAVGSPRNAAITEELVLADPGCDVLVYTMFRTKDGEAIVEEVVSYYLAHGSIAVLVADNSDHDRVEKVLQPYIAAHRVIYERLRKLEIIGSETETAVHEGGSLRSYALSFARLAQLSTKPFWLLSVDDDEFLLPMSSEQGVPADPTKSICSFLSQPKTQEWKSIRFRWKMWGSSGLQETPPERLSIESYTHSSPQLEKSGKAAYHLNHPDTDLTTWVDQDNMLTGKTRFGGPYFMHGNNQLLAKREEDEEGPRLWGKIWKATRGVNYKTRYKEDKTRGMLQSCCTNHFMRGLKAFHSHFGNWNGTGFRRNEQEELERRDQNQNENKALAFWGCPVRRVMEKVASKPLTAECKT